MLEGKPVPAAASAMERPAFSAGCAALCPFDFAAGFLVVFLFTTAASSGAAFRARLFVGLTSGSAAAATSDAVAAAFTVTAVRARGGVLL